MALTKCPTCGAELPEHAAHCPMCGAEIKRFCPQCGAQTTSTSSFCGVCGSRIEKPAEHTAPAYGQTPYPAYVPTSPVAASPSAGKIDAPVKGKVFAIIAFVLAVVTFLIVCFAWGWEEGIKETEEELRQMSSSEYYYYIENLEELYAAFKAFCIMAIITAVASDALVVFAYLGHAKNVKNGVQAKYVLVFAIIATAIANLFLIIAISMLA